MLKRWLACLTVTLALSGPAAAASFEDALAAYNARDYATAAPILRGLAEQGDAKAQYTLGLIYRDGKGVPQDYAQATLWLRKAAEQSDADAQYTLGLMYEDGKGVPQDYAQAASWCRKAAEQGNAFAQYTLGTMYAIGKGVPLDYVHAHKWVNLAVAQDNLGPVRESLSQLRDILAKKMTPAQIAEAQKLAREWKPK